MTIPFHGTYTRSQLSEADKVAAVAFGRGSTRQATGCLGVGTLVLVALAVAQAVQKNTSGAWEWAALAVLPALLFFWNVRAVRGARKLTIATPISGTLSNDGFQIDTTNTQSRLTWDVLTASHCGPDLILLLGKANELFVFPRSFFTSDDDFRNACELVRSVTPQKPKAKIVNWPSVFRTVILLLVIMIVLIIWHAWSH